MSNLCRLTSPQRLLRRYLQGWGLATAIAAFVLVPAPSQGGGIADWWANKMAPAPDSTDPLSGDVRTDSGLMSRWMTREKTPFSSRSLDSNNVLIGQKGWESTKVKPDPVSEGEFKKAKVLFDAKKYAEAEPLLAALAKREMKKGTPWGEKAQYYLAETQFQRENYVGAYDNFERLHKQFGATEYQDKLIAREYQIAQKWLASDDPKAKTLPFRARFDGRSPMVDRSGFGLKALESVRTHDPNGPLADHAALRTADHYHAVGDYEQAAIYYDQLLDMHKKSPLRERAQLSSIDAKIKGYIGPEYDVSGLDSARETIKRTMAEFPEHEAGNEELYHINDLITEQAAERDYTTANYYLRAHKPTSAEYYYGLVVAKYPKSKWAELAKVQLQKTAKMPRQASVPSRMMTSPGAQDPSGGMGGGGSGSGMGGMGGMGGGGMGGMPGMGMGGAPF